MSKKGKRRIKPRAMEEPPKTETSAQVTNSIVEMKPPKIVEKVEEVVETIRTFPWWHWRRWFG
jgi:hypothetical protein